MGSIDGFAQFFRQGNSGKVALAKMVEERFGCEGNYAPRLEKIFESHGSLDEYAIQLRGDQAISKHSLMTISHGDPWFNNMLFKYNADGVVEKVKMVDFQVANYTSVTVDLSYFLFSSTTGE